MHYQMLNEIVADFVQFTNDDLKNSISHSQLNQKLSHLKKVVDSVSQDLDHGKVVVKQVRKSVKAVHRSGKELQQCEASFASILAELSEDAFKCGAMDPVGGALSKFSTVFREIGLQFSNLLQSLSNVLFSPLDTFVNSELKVDLRKGYDKALKEYEARSEKAKKERHQQARESRIEGSPFETGDNLMRERRLLQMQLCEFFIVTTDVSARKQSYLVQYLTDYYAAQVTYFKESLSALQQLGTYLRDMAESLDAVRCEHDRERRSLVKLRDELRSAVDDREGGGSTSTLGSYSLHQNQGNPAHGTAKSGYLLKRSGSKVKKVWQKRRAVVSNGSFLLYHADDSRPPVSLPLLTCQVRPPGQRRCVFSLVSNNRTYSFQCDTPQEAEHWVSVLSNAKTDAFQVAIGGSTASVSGSFEYRGNGLMASSDATDGSAANSGVEKETLHASVLREVRALPGNNACADCPASDPEWISVNLGVLICLECCGIHRDLGVHVSRTQSLLMDDLTPAQLLVSRFMGNAAFNAVFEAELPNGVKPGSSANWRVADLQYQMNTRKSFIRAKYVERSYVSRTKPDKGSSLACDLARALRHHRLPMLLQVFAEGYELLTPRDDLSGETALHTMLRDSRATSGSGGGGSFDGFDSSELEDDAVDDELSGVCLPRLAMLEFTLQNSTVGAQRRCTSSGRENLVHYCVRYDQPECLRICLRAPGLADSAAVSGTNQEGLTAMELGQRLGGREACAQILHAVKIGDLSVLDNPLEGAVDHLVLGGGSSGGGNLSSGASFLDLRSLCSEDAIASRSESPTRQSSSGGGGEGSSFVPILRRTGAMPKKLHRAPPPQISPEPTPHPPPLPPLPTLLLPPPHLRVSSSASDSYDSVQIVIEAAMEGIAPASAEDAESACRQVQPPLQPTPTPLQPPPPLKPKPALKPKPRLTRISMPPQQQQSLAFASYAHALGQDEADLPTSSASVAEEHPPQLGSTSF